MRKKRGVREEESGEGGEKNEVKQRKKEVGERK